MYYCVSCGQEISLTKCQYEKIKTENINIKCDCGYLDIMVGADEIDGEYHVYSYDRKKDLKLKEYTKEV